MPKFACLLRATCCLQGKGNEFIALPVSDVFTFKPALQRRHQRCAAAAGVWVPPCGRPCCATGAAGAIMVCSDMPRLPHLKHAALVPGWPCCCSLEEAEAAMQAQRQQHERANPRLARAVAQEGGVFAAAGRGRSGALVLKHSLKALPQTAPRLLSMA